jgi:hypothetical protein
MTKPGDGAGSVETPAPPRIGEEDNHSLTKSRGPLPAPSASIDLSPPPLSGADALAKKKKGPRPPKKGENAVMSSQDIARAHIKCVAEIVQRLIKAYETKAQVNVIRLKQLAAAQYNLPTLPKLMDIIAAIPEDWRERLTPFLRVKPVRTASGIAVVAVMCKPHRCPHITFTGNVCSYCPGGLDSDFEYSTQAYTGYEPTSMRAIRARYNPYLQVRARLSSIGRSVPFVPAPLSDSCYFFLLADPLPRRAAFIFGPFSR